MALPDKIHVNDIGKYKELSNFAGANMNAKKNKYNAEKTVYNGVKFDSKKEAKYCETLDVLVRIGEVVRYEMQVPFKCVVNKQKICTYKLDFQVQYKDRMEYVDVKGIRTRVYIIKKKLVEALFDIKITEK